MTETTISTVRGDLSPSSDALRLRLLMEALHAFAEASADPATILELMAETAAQHTGGTSVVRLVPSDRDQLETTIIVEPSPAGNRPGRLSTPDTHDEGSAGGLAGWVLQSGEALMLADLSPPTLAAYTATGTLLYPEEAAAQSLLIVPLAARDRTIGTLTVARSEGEPPFSPGDQFFVQELAFRAAFVLDKARLVRAEQEVRQAAERATARILRLQGVTAALSGALTPADVIEIIIEQGMGALEANAGSVVLISEDPQYLEIVAAHGYSSLLQQHWTRFPLTSQVPLAEAVLHDETLWLESREALLGRFPALERTQLEYHAFACLPIRVQERVIGAVGLSFNSPRLFSEEDRAFMTSIVRQCGQAMDRARLFDEERRARAEAEATQQKLAFLSRASKTFASSLDYEATLSNVAHLIVPALADWCMIEMAGENGDIQLVANVHVEPAHEEMLREIYRLYPIEGWEEHPVRQIFETGQSRLATEVPDGMWRQMAKDDEHLRRLEALKVVSFMNVPLIARGRTLGAITLSLTGSERRYDPSDLALAEELARRAAVAVDNARLYREAQEAIGIRDQFFSIASHELKTPLTTVKGYAELLYRRAQREGKNSSPRDARALRIIHEESIRLNKLIELLLDVSRVQIGRLHMTQGRVNIVELTQRIAEILQPTLEHHSLKLVVPGEAIFVAGDELRLEQVVENLVGNAVKYSPDGGTVTIQLEEAAQRVIIAITDEGVGIPSDSLNQLFDRFYRASNVEQQGINGMGLGLYIVEHIIEAHGGTVHVRSELGAGSTFTIELPVLDVATLEGNTPS